MKLQSAQPFVSVQVCLTSHNSSTFPRFKNFSLSDFGIPSVRDHYSAVKQSDSKFVISKVSVKKNFIKDQDAFKMWPNCFLFVSDWKFQGSIILLIK